MHFFTWGKPTRALAIDVETRYYYMRVGYWKPDKMRNMCLFIVSSNDAGRRYCFLAYQRQGFPSTIFIFPFAFPFTTYPANLFFSLVLKSQYVSVSRRVEFNSSPRWFAMFTDFSCLRNLSRLEVSTPPHTKQSKKQDYLNKLIVYYFRKQYIFHAAIFYAHALTPSSHPWVSGENRKGEMCRETNLGMNHST